MKRNEIKRNKKDNKLIAFKLLIELSFIYSSSDNEEKYTSSFK